MFWGTRGRSKHEIDAVVRQYASTRLSDIEARLFALEAEVESILRRGVA